MKQLLIVGHYPSVNTQDLATALLEGAKYDGDVSVKCLSPLDTCAQDLLDADGTILFTTENFGYMSGALKDLFDRTYYEIIDHSRGTPYCLVVRAGKDGTGAIRACESIIKGLGWHKVQDVTLLHGEFQERFIEQCRDLAEGFAAGLDAGIY